VDFLNPREPVNAWSHGLWLLLVLPGSWLLWRRSGGDRVKRLSLLIYGLSLVFCSAASTLFHGVQPARYRVATFALLDYLGIYFLIAGSYTAIAGNLLRGRWRRGVLALVWAWAVAGSLLHLAWTTLPLWLSTGLYLSMGWVSIFCYFEVARRLSHRVLFPVLVGGVLYSVGAVFNLLHRPVLWPGVFQAHELFHLFVVAGSLVHFWFVLTVVVPFADGPGIAPPPPQPQAETPRSRRGREVARRSVEKNLTLGRRFGLLESESGSGLHAARACEVSSALPRNPPRVGLPRDLP
jgi:hemolysin III